MDEGKARVSMERTDAIDKCALQLAAIGDLLLAADVGQLDTRGETLANIGWLIRDLAEEVSRANSEAEAE